MIWKILSVVLASLIKTFFAPAAGFAEGLSFGTTFAATTIGAIAGFFLFYYIFGEIINRLNRQRQHPSAKRLKKARKIVTMKRKYPVWLFVPMLPVLSIPVMALVVRKFFHHKKPVFALSLVTVTLFALVGCLVFSPIQYL